MQGIKSLFPELGSCFGAAPAAETIVAEAPSNRRRRMRPRNSRKQWRPALTVIEENGGVRESCRKKSAELTNDFRLEKKTLIKSKLAGNNRSDSYGSEYRKSGHQMALPVFSPTPFLF